MTVTLRISNDAARMNGAEPQKVFDEQGGTIGRAAGNDWVLPDPGRFLSSHHAAVYVKDGAWYLADTSANGVYVNGATQPVGSDAPARLNDGDSLRLGDYEIEVRLEERATLTPQAPDDWATPASPQAPADSATPAAPPDFHPRPTIPETLDPLELLTGSVSSKSAPQTPAPPQAPITDRDVLGPINPLEIGPMGSSTEPFLTDIPTSAAAGSHRDDVAMVQSGFRAPDASPEQIPEDWNLAASPLQPPPAAPIPQPVAPPAPEPSPSAAPAAPPTPPPTPASEMPLAEPAPPTEQPTIAATPASDAMLRAFFEGTGLDPAECLANADPELPRLLGEIFREVVTGMHAVLVARAHLKSGFRMNVTIIRERENNPLKFSAGGTEEAMRNLLFHSGSGYLSPLEAVREGFDDLKKHQVAVMSGMKAALLSVLQRFDPENLEEEFDQRAKTGSLLRSKQAQYWEHYAEFYQRLLTEVDDDFHDSIGRIFVKSYEEQLERLSSAGKNNDTLK